jgi:outer membrane lipase/esterase
MDRSYLEASLSKPSRSALGAAALVSGMLAGAPAATAPPSPAGLVVFGDSLSDSGNAGRFSNGPVWVEHIAQRIGANLAPSRQGGTNHAVGGARSHDMRAQADGFLAVRRGRLDPQALYIVYGGGNDLLAAIHATDRGAVIQDAAAAIGGIVADLASAGAVQVLVPNLPDLGIRPALRALGVAAAAEARMLTRAYNEALEQALDRVEADHPVRIRRLDVFALAERVMADPAAAGFGNVTDPCLGGSCEGMLFWDQAHPTALAHARLAQAALASAGASSGLTVLGRVAKGDGMGLI